MSKVKKQKSKSKEFKQSDVIMEFVIYHERTDKLLIATVLKKGSAIKDSAKDKKTLFESALIGVL